MAFGGGGFGSMPDTLERTCGDTSPCARESTKFNFTGGAAYWLTPWLGAEGSLFKLLAVETNGQGEDYEMISSVSPRILTVAALGGLNIKSARFYGRMVGLPPCAWKPPRPRSRAPSIDGVITTYRQQRRRSSTRPRAGAACLAEAPRDG